MKNTDRSVERKNVQEGTSRKIMLDLNYLPTGGHVLLCIHKNLADPDRHAVPQHIYLLDLFHDDHHSR